jgi:hypothetical protein
MVDTVFLREHYGMLQDDELQRLAQGELVPEARAILEEEMKARGVVPLATPNEASVISERSKRERKVNPYHPPGAAVADPMVELAELKVSGLLRLFQAMVVASTAIGLVLFFWPYLPLPISPPGAAFRGQAGAGALAPAVSQVAFYVAQPMWILSAIGLYFLRWWGRFLLVATYALTSLASLVGGMQVQFEFESLLATIATLMDGAVLALAFLPPLSKYFARDAA